MIKKKKQYKEMTLHGYPIRIYKNKVVIINKDKLDLEDFKPKALSISQYLMDESFVNVDEIMVETRHSFK